MTPKSEMFGMCPKWEISLHKILFHEQLLGILYKNEFPV
jgi:hypothetical protein